MDWIGAVVVCIALYLLSIKSIYAFWVYIGSCVIWIIWGIDKSFAIVCMNIIFIFFNGYCIWKWSEEKKGAGKEGRK